ncbi:hypothetical protein [Kitasatospora sp. NPDC094015]|uniref:hypothetical protein n=1 Tax=Kitasatospora sp. NPDC094015 TaxID=3155205 RepID=UPI00331B0127
MNDPKSYDALSALVFVLGVYEGVLPFPARLFDWQPLLSLTVRLSSPAWWIVSGLVVVVATVLLAQLDRAKRRRFPDA